MPNRVPSIVDHTVGAVVMETLNFGIFVLYLLSHRREFH